MPDALHRPSDIINDGAIPLEEREPAAAEREVEYRLADELLPAIDAVRTALGPERADDEVKRVTTRPLSFRVRIRRHVRGFSDLRYWTVYGGDPAELAVAYRWLTDLAGRLGWIVRVEHHGAGAAVSVWRPEADVDPEGRPLAEGYHAEVAVALARALADAIQDSAEVAEA